MYGDMRQRNEDVLAAAAPASDSTEHGQVEAGPSTSTIQREVEGALLEVLGSSLPPDEPLISAGLDSLGAVEYVNLVSCGVFFYFSVLESLSSCEALSADLVSSDKFGEYKSTPCIVGVKIISCQLFGLPFCTLEKSLVGHSIIFTIGASIFSIYAWFALGIES